MKNLLLGNCRLPSSVAPHLFLLTAVVIWSSTFIGIKVVLAHIPPNTLALLRFLLASVCFLVWFSWRGMPRVALKDIPRILFCGLTGVALYNFLQNQGLKTAEAIDASILAAMAPIFIAVLALIFLRERLSWLQFLGIILALGGSGLVITNGSADIGTLGRERLIGDGLILLTGLCWGFYNIVLKALLGRYDPTVVLAYSTWAGTLLLLPLALGEKNFVLGNIPITAWLHVAYLGFFASALAYLLWNKALIRMQTAVAGTYLYLIPVITALMAAAYLGETPGIFACLGGAAVLLGTYLASRSGNASSCPVEKTETNRIA